MIDPSVLGLGCAVLTCVTWGIADFLAARVSRQFGEFTALLRIQTVGAPVLIAAWVVLRPGWPSATDAAWISAASLCFVVGYLSFLRGLRIGAVSLVSPISSAGAVVPIATGIIVFGETASALRLVGGGVLLSGIMILMADPTAIDSLPRQQRRDGLRAGLITLVAWGSGTALLLPAIHRIGAFAPVAMLRVEVLAILVLWALVRAARSEPASDSPSAPGTRFAAWRLVVPAALLDLTAFFAYGVALRDAPASVAAPIASGYPLITILLARRYLTEHLYVREWIGVGLTLTGVGLLGAGCCDPP